MRWLAIVALLAIALPVKGQNESGKTDAQAKYPENIELSRASPRPTGVVNQQAPSGNKNRSSAESDGYLHHLLLPETLAAIVLGIVGIVGICVAIKSLKTIQRQALIMIQQTRVFTRQAKASEDAIAAAKISSDTLANIERAWVDVRLAMQWRSQLYSIEITNYGRTVADIRRIVTESTIIREGADAGSAVPHVIEYRKSKLLFPNQPWSPLTVNMEGDFGTGILQQLRKGEMRMSYRVVVHYVGITPDCRSECLYYWKNAGSDGFLVPVEAPEYNQHT